MHFHSLKCRIHDVKVRPKDLSFGPEIDTRAISLGIFHADSMMKNPGGRARYNNIRLNSTRRVESFQPSLAQAWGLELERDNIVFCPSAINWSRSVERTKLLIQIPKAKVISANDSTIYHS